MVYADLRSASIQDVVGRADGHGELSEDIYALCEGRLGPGEMNYHFSISLKYKYFYCEVSKAGCSATKIALWQHEIEGANLPDKIQKVCLSPHRPINEHILIKPFQLGRELFNSYLSSPEIFKFAVVRNPYSRALSGYLDKVVRGEAQFNTLRPNISVLRGCDPLDIDHKTVTFLEFCEALKIFKRPRQFDQHWRPQAAHICSSFINYDLFAKLESIDEGMEIVSKKTGVKHISKERGRDHATSANDKVMEFYSESTASIIRDIYKDDFELFGYSLDIDRASLPS